MAKDLEAGQQCLKKDDDILSSKDKEKSLAAIQRANKAHGKRSLTGLDERALLTRQVLSLDTTFPMEFPEAPLAGRPVNFGIVVPGVYRSSYPQREDYAYIQRLQLKTLV